MELVINLFFDLPNLRLLMEVVCFLFWCVRSEVRKNTEAQLAGKKLWQIWQITKFFANIPDEARGHAVCVVNIRHVKQGT